MWSYFGGRSMASSLEHFCLIKDSVTLGLNREVINMKKKFWLTLYNIGVSILFLLSLYSYAKGMAGFPLHGNVGLVFIVVVHLLVGRNTV